MLGAAILAGLGVKIFGDPAQACARMNRVKERFKPIKENSLLYDRLYEIFKDLHNCMQSRFKRLHEIS